MLAHKVGIYKEYHSVFLLVGIGTLPSPNPSLASECAPPPRTGGGADSPAGEGLGESQTRRLEKKLSTLPTLWGGWFMYSRFLYCTQRNLASLSNMHKYVYLPSSKLKRAP
jgi:hypothetical protein